MQQETLISACVTGFRKNALPGVVLLLFALAIALSYYYIPAVEALFSQVGALKKNYGFLYSGISTAIFAGVLPFTYLYFSKQAGPVHAGAQLLFYVLFWIVKGMEVDLLYRCQSLMFGEEKTVSVIAMKVAFDQFIYVPIFALPSMSICFLWKDCAFSFKKLWSEMNARFVKIVMPSILISNWMVWIPAVAVVYSMPDDLQIPLFNIVLCFYVLIVAMLARQSKPQSDA